MKLLLIRILKLIFPGRRKSDDSVKKILVIRQDNRIGNLLFITALLREIKKAYPSATLDLLASGKFSEIYDRSPYIDNAKRYYHRENIIKPWKLLSLIRKLRRFRYDLVFDTKDVFSFNNAMFTVVSGGTETVGYGYEGSEIVHDINIPIPSDSLYEPQRHLELLKAVTGKIPVNCDMEIFLDDSEVEHGRLLLENHGLLPGEFIAVHCGGRGVKSYGVKRFIKTAEILYSESSLKSLLIYGPDERDEIKRITLPENIIPVEPEDIRQMASLIYHCKTFLSGDTGALHVAISLGKSTVSIFFRSNSARYAPKGELHTLFYDFDKPPNEETVVELVKERIKKDVELAPESDGIKLRSEDRYDEDLITIVLATFNGERFISEQIQSLLDQSYSNFHIICVDDCSEDNTIGILRDFQSKHPDKITIHRNDTNLGSRKNFEKGCSLADGKYVALSDQDDWWHPDKLKILHNKISQNERLAFVYSNAEHVDRDLKTMNFRIWNSHEVFRGNEYYEVVIRNVVMGCTILARKDFINEVMPFPSKGMHHDYYLATMAAARNYEVDFVDMSLVKYRQHEYNVVGRDKKFKKKTTYRDKTLRRYYEVALLDYDKIENRKLSELLKLRQTMLENMIRKKPLKAFKYHRAYYKALDKLNLDIKSHKWQDFRIILRSIFYKWPRIDFVQS